MFVMWEVLFERLKSVQILTKPPGTRTHAMHIRGSNFSILELRKKLFFDQKPQIIYILVSMIDVRTIGEAFGPQKRTSSTQNMKYLNF
jgi:hypothetical protein